MPSGVSASRESSVSPSTMLDDWNWPSLWRLLLHAPLPAMTGLFSARLTCADHAKRNRTRPATAAAATTKPRVTQIRIGTPLQQGVNRRAKGFGTQGRRRSTWDKWSRTKYDRPNRAVNLILSDLRPNPSAEHPFRA